MRVDTKYKTAWYLFALFASALIGGCSLLGGNVSQDSLQDDSLETSVVATVNALNSATPVPAISLPHIAATATPSIGLKDPNQTPSASITSIPSPVWGDFATPSRPSSTEIPPPMPEIVFGSGAYNALLLGTDERPGTGGFRTDAIMIVSINPDTDFVTMLSVPRDLYVYIPGYRMNRINTAMVVGGFKMLSDTILYNFGIPLDGWARVEFTGFVSAIDTLGGLSVQSTAYVRDECRGDIHTYQAGQTYEMDGTEALCYVRMRKSGGDFDRMRRQQEVVRAIFSKVLSIDGLSHIPQLYNQFFTMLIMDIDVLDLIPLVPTAAQIGSDPSRIQQYRVDRDLVELWRTPGGGSVLLPKRAEIQQMLMDAFGSDAFKAAE